MSLTLGAVTGIAEKLKKMPEIRNDERVVSKQEAVKLLSKEIAAMQKRGYTLEQIAEALTGEGLDIATPTLKNYLHRVKPAKEKALRQRKGAEARDRPVADDAAPRPVGEKKKKVSDDKATFSARADSNDI